MSVSYYNFSTKAVGSTFDGVFSMVPSNVRSTEDELPHHSSRVSIHPKSSTAKANPTTHHGGTKQREWRRDDTGHDGLDPSALFLSRPSTGIVGGCRTCVLVGRFGRRSVVRDIPSCGRYDVGEIPFASLPCHFNYWNGF